MTVVPIDKNAKRAPLESADLQELGTPGTQFYKGFLKTDEYVPDLIGNKGLETFEKMRRSDGMVSAALRSIKLPLISAKWDVEPASEDAQDREIADRLAENLFENMSLTWQDHLRQVLTHLDFGHYVCEKVWEVRDDVPARKDVLEYVRSKPALADGSITFAAAPTRAFFMWSGTFATETLFSLKKLAPRLQRTIYLWNLEDDGGLRSVTQWAYRQDGKYDAVEIPVGKLLVFVNEKEGANWMGKSLLRPAYKHWFIKDQLYRIDAIAAERHGVGIPVMELPEDKSDKTNMDRAEDILSGIRSHERGYVVTPFGYKFSVEGMGQGRAMDLMPIIQHHDRMIAVSVLAQFLTLGANPQGSFALSEDHSSFFMLAEKAVAMHVADVHNRYLIPQWVNFNYAGVRKYPKLAFGAIETRDIEKLINALVPAVNAGLITADDKLEAAIRRMGELPEHDVATARIPVKVTERVQTNDPTATPSDVKPGDGPAPTPKPSEDPGTSTSTSQNPPDGGANA